MVVVRVVKGLGEKRMVGRMYVILIIVVDCVRVYGLWVGFRLWLFGGGDFFGDFEDCGLCDVDVIG